MIGFQAESLGGTEFQFEYLVGTVVNTYIYTLKGIEQEITKLGAILSSIWACTTFGFICSSPNQLLENECLLCSQLFDYNILSCDHIADLNLWQLFVVHPPFFAQLSCSYTIQTTILQLTSKMMHPIPMLWPAAHWPWFCIFLGQKLSRFHYSSHCHWLVSLSPECQALPNRSSWIKHHLDSS